MYLFTSTLELLLAAKKGYYSQHGHLGDPLILNLYYLARNCAYDVVICKQTSRPGAWSFNPIARGQGFLPGDLRGPRDFEADILEDQTESMSDQAMDGGPRSTRVTQELAIQDRAYIQKS